MVTSLMHHRTHAFLIILTFIRNSPYPRLLILLQQHPPPPSRLADALH